jgi:hypothetical protein
MRYRTRMFAATAAVAALTGSLAATAPAASAATVPPAKSCVAVKQASGTGQSAKLTIDDSALAARLGVSTARLDQALRELKMTLAKTGAAPTQHEFDATLAHLLGISQERVRQVFPDVTATGKNIKVTIAKSPSPGTPGLKSPGSQPPCGKLPGGKLPGGKLPSGKVPVPQQSQQQVNAALAAAVAAALHVSTAQVESALQPLFAAGRADPSSPAFATAAQQLGVSVQQLTSALGQAKQSLAPAS